MKFTAFLVNFKHIHWELESQGQQGYLWRSRKFPQLRLQSPDQYPFGKDWEIAVKEEFGKPPGNNEKYPLNLRLRLFPTQQPVTEEIVWIYDSGRYFTFRSHEIANAKFASVFGQPPMGWLGLVVRSLLQPAVEVPPLEPVPVAEPVAEASPVKTQTKVKARLSPAKPSSRGTRQDKASEASAFINKGINNEQRAKESIAIVQETVKELKLSYDWESLQDTQKIKLIKARVKEVRKVSISIQTLYRDWIRPIWQKVET